MYFYPIFTSFKVSAYHSYNYRTPNTEFTTNLIFSGVLPSQNILPPALPYNFYVVSDENEDLYFNTAFGYIKYKNNGELDYEVKVNGNNTINSSNLIYVNNKIIFLSKKFPGTIYTYNSTTGELLSTYDTFLQSEKPANLNSLTYSEISIDTSENNIYFATNHIFKIHRYNIPLNILQSYDLKQESITFTGGTFLLEPAILDDSKVVFVTSRGIIYVFDTNNIANYIYLTSFRGEFNFLYSTSIGNYVPLSFSPNNFYIKYGNYLCLFSKTDNNLNTCKFYVDAKNKEGAEQINPLNINENTFAVINKNFTGTKEFYLAKYSNDLSREWDKGLGGNIANGGINKDAKNNIISSSNIITKINSENGEVLGTYSTNMPSGFYFYRSSIASITANGDYYVFVQNKKANQNVYNNTIYKFKGEKEEALKPCPLGIYCNSTPKHNPVIIIHGLGGHYTNFLNEKTGILRTKILEDFRIDDPEFPDSWVYSYSYGYNFGGTYNYQGKIEDISSNLHFDIPRLSNEHLLAGGNGKVTLIGYSLGGLIARHYLLEKTGYPGEQNLNVDTKVNKVIFIASPINGSSVLQGIYDLGRFSPKIRDLSIKIINNTVSSYQNEDIDISKDIGEQLNTDSKYINLLNNYNFPSESNFYRNYANITAEYSYNLFGSTLSKSVELGDIIVHPNDTALINASFTGSFVQKQNIGVNLSYINGELSFNHNLLLNSLRFNHLNILEQSEIISSVLNQLKE